MHIPFEKQMNDLRIINVGSVGQPQNGDPEASCILLDAETFGIEFIKVSNDVETVASQISKKMP